MRVIVFLKFLCLLSFLSCKDGVVVHEVNSDIISVDSIFNEKGGLLEVRTTKNDTISMLALYYPDRQRLRKIIKYLAVDTGMYPNQFLIFGENGDTLNSESLYYDIYCVKDTVSFTGEYEFKIILSGHIYDSARIYMCNYDLNFTLDSLSSKCDIFQMDNMRITLSTKPKTKGWNYVRAKIDNYQNYELGNGADSSVYISTYVLDSFYVLP